ncbi:MAG: 3-phosphoshikimate 1-carboxyvinyltransferase [Candidatus Dormibacteria bacterium]
MKLTAPGRIRGEVIVPGDKSISHRALLVGGMADGNVILHGRGAGADQDSMVDCLRAMGVAIEEAGGAPGTPEADTRVSGRGLRGFLSPRSELDCGNSGNTMRFLMGALAGQPGVSATLVGDTSLSQRPMERVALPLRRMGASVETSSGGTAPVLVVGAELSGLTYDLPVASAQLKTAILLAALNARGRTVVREPGFSRDHTERLLERLGVRIHHHLEVWIEPPGRLPGFEVTIPGDPSSAAFWAVLAAIHPDAEVLLRGVCVNPARNRFTRVLARMGARIDVRNVRDLDGEPVADIAVSSSRLRATDIEPAEVPGLLDEIPVLAVAAAFAEGESCFRGLAELRLKEVDRLAAVVDQVGRLGVEVAVLEDDLYIGGLAPGRPHGAAVDSLGDHRIAMSLAIAAAAADGASELDGAEAAAVSYPEFFTELERLSG